MARRLTPRLAGWTTPPRLRTVDGGEEDRHATWLETFADLVFVVAVAQIASTLAHDPSARGFLRFAGLFVPALWAWMGFTFYANRFDTDDVIYRALICVGMLAITALAVNVPAVVRGHGVPFAISYVAVRVVLLTLYARARHHVQGAARRASTLYLRGFTLGAALWLVSIVVPAPARYALWAAGLAVDLSMPPIAWSALASARLNPAHVTERFGLFFIIVLGEGVFGVVSGTAHVTFGARTSLLGAFSFLLVVCVWWIYFDFADTSVIGRGKLGLVYMYGHFPLLGGVAAMGVGIRLAIIGATHSGLLAGARWALCGGVAAYLLALAWFHATAEWTTLRDRVIIGRVLVAAGALVLAAAGNDLPPVVLVAILASGLLGQLALEAKAFPQGAASVWTPANADASATP